MSVLTTAVNPALPSVDSVDDVMVYRVSVNVRRRRSKAAAAARLVRRLFAIRATFDIVHLHGFSQKNVPVTIVARLLGKRIVLTLHTAGQDEPNAIRRRGRLESWAFASADLVLSVSPYMSDRYHDAGLPPERLRLTPNGIDVNRFRPVAAADRLALRRALGWRTDRPVVLFVGFFSRDKRPDFLFRAWRRLAAAEIDSTLVFVGATRSSYYEIDDSLATEIRTAAAAAGVADSVVFVEPTNAIAHYLQAADVFVLPSARETQSLALLEAMACGLPTIASRLPGATDAFVEDGVNGRLFAVDDEAALAEALRDVLSSLDAAQAMGARARDTVCARYSILHTAEQWLAAYHDVLAHPR
jgi:glycosyltransferase involved in cell wall biosynthesis